ncbi:MAG: hypothetical protein ACLS3M_04395 [Collinsella sp.]
MTGPWPRCEAPASTRSSPRHHLTPSLLSNSPAARRAGRHEDALTPEECSTRPLSLVVELPSSLPRNTSVD